MIRRAIGLVLALALIVTGAAALIYLLFFAAGWAVWIWMGAGAVFIAGLLWLYADFIDATPNEEQSSWVIRRL